MKRHCSFVLLLVLALLLPSTASAYHHDKKKRPMLGFTWQGEFAVKHAEAKFRRDYTDGTVGYGSQSWAAGPDGGGTFRFSIFMVRERNKNIEMMNLAGVLEATVGANRDGPMFHVQGGVDIVATIFKFGLLVGGSFYPATFVEEPGKGTINISGLSIGVSIGMFIPLKTYEKGRLELEMGAVIQHIAGADIGFRVPLRAGLTWKSW